MLVFSGWELLSRRLTQATMRGWGHLSDVAGVVV